ncbi:MAG: vWA domain-containing protein [Pirellulales bacterium]
MPYSQEISRQNKALFVFLLDQSYSMEEPIANSERRKMDELATAINGWLQNMTIRATSSEGIRDWIDIGVIGYRTDQDANPIIESPLGGTLKGEVLVSIVDIGNNPARMEQRVKQFFDEDTGELVETPVEVPVWVEPKAEGGTPMCNALYRAYELVEKWIQEHPRSYPPVVIHITDGESQDGDPIPYADPLRGLATEDGNVLLFNCHLSMTPGDPFLFPASGEILPDELARVLYKMSSDLPEKMFQSAIAEGFELQSGARGMAFNADMVSLIKFLDMGTRVAKTLR